MVTGEDTGKLLETKEERIHRSLEFFTEDLNLESNETPRGLRTVGVHSLLFLTELVYQQDNSESLYGVEWVRGINGPVSSDVKDLTDEYGKLKNPSKKFMDNYEVLTGYPSPRIEDNELEEYLDKSLDQLEEDNMIKPRAGGWILTDRTPVIEQSEINRYLDEICPEYRETLVTDTVELSY